MTATRRPPHVLIAAAVLVAIGGFLPLYAVAGRSAVALAVIPILVAGGVWGAITGFLVAVAWVPANAVLLLLAGEPEMAAFMGRNFWFTHAVFAVVGLGVGHVRDLRRRLERELNRREVVEARLREALDELAAREGPDP